MTEILNAGNAKLAGSYVVKCTDLPLQSRVDLWEKCGMLDRAGEEALRARNMNILQQLKSKATGQQALDIDRMIAQLSRR